MVIIVIFLVTTQNTPHNLLGFNSKFVNNFNKENATGTTQKMKRIFPIMRTKSIENVNDVN